MAVICMPTGFKLSRRPAAIIHYNIKNKREKPGRYFFSKDKMAEVNRSMSHSSL